MRTKSERFELRLDQSILDRIDEWKDALPDRPSRSEAVRRLVDQALTHESDRQLFQHMRFTVLTAALTIESAHIDNAYVFAWDKQIYPVQHESVEFHLPFASHFRVSRDMMDDLLELLDQRWNAGDPPTFYQLEDLYRVRHGGPWDRMGLVAACRYLRLMDLFDEAFWSKLLSPAKHPSEAKRIERPFDRKKELSLG